MSIRHIDTSRNCWCLLEGNEKLEQNPTVENYHTFRLIITKKGIHEENAGCAMQTEVL